MRLLFLPLLLYQYDDDDDAVDDDCPSTRTVNGSRMQGLTLPVLSAVSHTVSKDSLSYHVYSYWRSRLNSLTPPNPAWRFMGSYKWNYKSPNIGYHYSYPTHKPLIATHDPPTLQSYTLGVFFSLRSRARTCRPQTPEGSLNPKPQTVP